MLKGSDSQASTATQSKGEVTCTKCGKKGLAYKCSWCEASKVCGECKKCLCGAETVINKKGLKASTSTAATAPGKPTKPQSAPKPAAETRKPSVSKGEWLESKIVQASASSKTKDPSRNTSPLPDGRKAGKPEEHRTRRAMAATLQKATAEIKTEALTGNVDAVVKVLEDHYRKYDITAKRAVAPGVANIDEPLVYATPDVRAAIDAAVASLDDKAKDARYASLLDEVVADAKKSNISKGEGYGRRLVLQALARASPQAVTRNLGKVFTQYGAGHFGSPQAALPAMWAVAQARDIDAGAAIEAWAKVMAPAIGDAKADPAVTQFAVAYVEALAKAKPVKPGRAVDVDMVSVINRCMGADVPKATRDRLDKPLAYIRDVWVLSLSEKERKQVFSRILVMLAKTDRNDSRAAKMASVLAKLLQQDQSLFGHWQAEYERLAKDNNTGFAEYASASVHAVRLMETPAGGATLVPRRAVKDVVQAFTTVNSHVLAGKQGKAAKRPAAQQVERCDLDMKAFLGNQRGGSRLQSLMRWLLLAVLTSAGLLKLHKQCKANPCTPAAQCKRYSPCKLIKDYNLEPHLDQASALADEQYAAYIAPLEPQIQAAYEVVSPHVDQAYQATQRVYQESIHPVVADGYDKAARFYSGNLGPHVDEAWRQAQPHIDTASQFYEENVHPGVMSAYDTAIEYGSQAAEVGGQYAAGAADWTHENIVKPAPGHFKATRKFLRQALKDARPATIELVAKARALLAKAATQIQEHAGKASGWADANVWPITKPYSDSASQWARENVAPATQPYTDAAWQWSEENVYKPAHPHAARAYAWLVENCVTPAQAHSQTLLAVSGEKWTAFLNWVDAVLEDPEEAARIKAEIERKAKEEAARKAKEEAERKAKEEAEGKAKEEAARKAKEEAARKAKEEAERKAKEEAERKAKEEAEGKAKEEAARKAKEEAERKAKEEAERKAREEAERKVKKEAERKAKEEAERKAQEEAERKAQGEAERQVKEEAQKAAKAQPAAESAPAPPKASEGDKGKEASEKANDEDAAREAEAKAEKKAKADAEKKAKAEAEKQAKAEAEKQAKVDAEKQVKADAEKQAKAEAEKQAKAEAEKKAQEAAKPTQDQKTSDAETKAREAARRLAEEKVKEQLAKAKRDQDLKDDFAKQKELFEKAKEAAQQAMDTPAGDAKGAQGDEL